MLKKTIIWSHKWMGLLTGLVVFLVSLSGAVYTFHDELKLLIYPEKYFIEPPGSVPAASHATIHEASYAHALAEVTPLPLSELILLAQEALPAEEEISRVDLYPAPNRSWIFRGSEVNPGAFGHWSYFKYYKRVFLNPYTGDLVAVEDSKNEFFQLMLQLHMNLLLGKTYGHAVVAYSTLVFGLLLITGMIAWWPKKWRGKALKRSLWLDRKAKWKRFNYDLHNVWGFYTFPVALILCITGLLFSFPEWKKPYAAFFNAFSIDKNSSIKGSSSESDNAIAPEDPHIGVEKIYDNPLDNLLLFALRKHPDAGMMSVRLRNGDSPLVDVQVRLREDRSGLFKWYYMRTNDLTMSETRSHENLPVGDLLSVLNFDLHTGTIGGIPTKILVCIIALGCSSLPITGYLVWWNKGKKRL